MDYTFMKQKAILPLVLSMSIPSILSMLINSLYNIVDSFFVAQISEEAMTAISIVFPLQNITLSIAVGFGVGINALIALLLGRKETHKADQAASIGIALSAVHGVVVMVVLLAILPVFLGWYTNDERVMDMAMQYATIVLLFNVATHIYIAVEKIYQSIGKMKTMMFVMAAGCIVNVILDPFLIFGIGLFPKLGIMGAALATGFGQCLQLVLYVVLYRVQHISLVIRFKLMRLDALLVKKMYGVGVPASLNMALPSLLISVLNVVLAGYGQMYVMILGVYYKLQTCVYVPANGLMQGVRPLIGYNLGAQEYGRVRKLFIVSVAIAALMMIAGTAVCWVFSHELMGLFSSNSETIEQGAHALRIISLGFLASAMSVSVAGTLEGLGLGKQSLIVSVLRYVVVVIPAVLILSMCMGVEGVWHAFWVTELIVACASIVVYRRAEEIALTDFKNC